MLTGSARWLVKAVVGRRYQLGSLMGALITTAAAKRGWVNMPADLVDMVQYGFYVLCALADPSLTAVQHEKAIDDIVAGKKDDIVKAVDVIVAVDKKDEERAS